MIKLSFGQNDPPGPVYFIFVRPLGSIFIQLLGLFLEELMYKINIDIEWVCTKVRHAVTNHFIQVPTTVSTLTGAVIWNQPFYCNSDDNVMLSVIDLVIAKEIKSKGATDSETELEDSEVKEAELPPPPSTSTPVNLAKSPKKEKHQACGLVYPWSDSEKTRAFPCTVADLIREIC